MSTPQCNMHSHMHTHWRLRIVLFRMKFMYFWFLRFVAAPCPSYLAFFVSVCVFQSCPVCEPAPGTTHTSTVVKFAATYAMFVCERQVGEHLPAAPAVPCVPACCWTIITASGWIVALSNNHQFCPQTSPTVTSVSVRKEVKEFYCFKFIFMCGMPSSKPFWRTAQTFTQKCRPQRGPETQTSQTNHNVGAVSELAGDNKNMPQSKCTF